MLALWLICRIFWGLFYPNRQWHLALGLWSVGSWMQFFKDSHQVRLLPITSISIFWCYRVIRCEKTKRPSSISRWQWWQLQSSAEVLDFYGSWTAQGRDDLTCSQKSGLRTVRTLCPGPWPLQPDELIVHVPPWGFPSHLAESMSWGTWKICRTQRFIQDFILFLDLSASCWIGQFKHLL